MLLQLCSMLHTPVRVRITAQILFQHTYPRLFKKESCSAVALVSIYLSSKINETLLKLEVLLDALSSTGCSVSRDRLVHLECRMVELAGFQFDIRPAHLFLLRIGKTLGLDVLARLDVLDDVHSDGRANLINYFSGMYNPEIVALSVLGDDEISLFECFFCASVDRPLVSEIRTVLFKKQD